MTKTIKLVVVAFVLFPIVAFGQKDDIFKIDTAKILANENLDTFVQILMTDTFQIFSDVNAIPILVGKQLSSLTNGFSITNSDRLYRCCCTSPLSLPKRQLSFLAKSKDVLVMTYKTGGFVVSTHLLLIRFNDKKIVDLWSGHCRGGIKHVDEVVSYIEDSRRNNRKLNTSRVNL